MLRRLKGAGCRPLQASTFQHHPSGDYMSYSNKRKGVNQYGRIAAQSEAGFASPHRLVQMLMEGALDKVATAKGLMLRKDYAGKSAQITWASSIVNGLRSGLDMEAGGEIAANLNDLYGYITRRLIDANVDNDLEALDEVTTLLAEIKGAWDAMPDAVRNAPQPAATQNGMTG
jgi:flagellar protein FliS